ncbi:tetratricopeptide repeat-containing sulfotransferase family protein [Solimicrobium silvestre]|uniref:Sulfotransferase domain n=1 Tax=Solimicrobium silvestre TaxID=2099400 RepID=A0A2S9H350_9BURK|nr:sulfotransferase [Solimicrobium silvestre]PRC94363.1 Sulfotransferase domain [Solimicrobium silvestre]
MHDEQSKLPNIPSIKTSDNLLASEPTTQEIDALVVLFTQRRYAEAETTAIALIARFPKHGFAWKALGTVHRRQGRKDEAVAALKNAAELMPEDAEAHNNLGNALREQGRSIDAETLYRHALELRPTYVEAHYNLGCVLKDQKRVEEAETQYRRALELNPDYVPAHNNLGNVLKEQGRLEEACASLETAITIKPNFIESHYSLSSLKTYHENDPHQDMLEALLGEVKAMPVEARIRYWFALGKMREDVGLYDASFAAYQEANRLQHALLPFDETADEAAHKRMMDVFSKEFLAQRARPIDIGKAPIFIVGMPRSGTSLLEQILSSYPGVFGAGELSDMSEVITAALPDAAFERFPDVVPDFSADDFKRLGEHYSERVARLAPTATHITDKMPANYYYVGMIYLMFPNAKIIHAMREPMDSCFSCYSRLFNMKNLAFSYDQGTLGRSYVRYIKLMRHWHEVLPPGTILDLRYEDMVADTEGQARRLLDYIGLPWNDQCLAFHENKRRVKTASAAQVRKPIYKTSLARWKRYEGHLGELFGLVKDYRDVGD